MIDFAKVVLDGLFLSTYEVLMKLNWICFFRESYTNFSVSALNISLIVRIFRFLNRGALGSLMNVSIRQYISRSPGSLNIVAM